MTDLAVPNGHCTHRVVELVVRCVVEDGLPYRTASWHLWREHRVFVPFATIQNWVEAAGEEKPGRGRRRVPGRRADPCRRLAFKVLDHAPAATDVTAFLKAFKRQLDARGLAVAGIATDGSAPYPGPLALLFAGVPHQVCSFHVIRELTRSFLRALAKVRNYMTAALPKLPRGRPAKARRRHAARVRWAGHRVAELFEHRYLFVTHHLTPAQRRTLAHVTRDLPELRRLRAVMDEVYRLFDRRCRTSP
jgi:hypothetical protein